MKKTKAQNLYYWLDKANRNEGKLPSDDAMNLYLTRLKEFGSYMNVLAGQGKLFEIDYKGNLRCVNSNKEDNNDR